MSYNLGFMYIKQLLTEQGPLPIDQICGHTPLDHDATEKVVLWAVANGSLDVTAGVYRLSEREAAR